MKLVRILIGVRIVFRGTDLPIWFTQGGAVLWVLGGLSVISLAAIIFVGVAQAKSRLRADAPQGPDAPSFLGRLADAFARTRQGGARQY